jgi:NADH-quinone oxidoreductase subunit L
LDWYFDGIAAVFLGLTGVITFLILLFSKYYMHRDPGFLRYFGTIVFFFAGLSVVILSGNLDVLFIGWEWIGISSFLLIAYYRDRFLPVRNALKVFSLYRIADALMILIIWLGHHAIGQGIGFSQYQNITAEGEGVVLIGMLLLVVALIKSAQFPFSYWLPRAMEGPTTSSAIFYGALSVHMGLFVLLRTYPLWEGSMAVRIAVGVSGLLTALIATSITRVQSSIKTQIAYASVTQIGLMFVELAFGLQWLVLLHMVSNAFLRTYQLLISPSIAGYLVHDQFFNFVKPQKSIEHTFLGRLRATLFVLSIKEWNMNALLTRYVWKPLKAIGRVVAFLDAVPVWGGWLALATVITGIIARQLSHGTQSLSVSYVAIMASILFFIRAYSTKHTPKTAWNLIMFGHLLVVLFFSFATESAWYFLFLYASGIIGAYTAGYLCLRHLRLRGETSLLFDYHGHVYEYPRLATVFLIICLGYMTFPIVPSFLGQDLLLSDIPERSVFHVLLFGVAYLLGGISIMRLYIKVFFGPHKKRYHETAHRSS